MAKFALIRLAMALALTTPPTSGETITTGLFLYFSSISFTNTGAVSYTHLTLPTTAYV